MKITIKINGAEVILEAQKPEEVAALGAVAASILEHSSPTSTKRTRAKTTAETNIEQSVANERSLAVQWVLETSHRPMNAPEISAEVKDLPSFYTKGGDSVHIVRRVLAEGVQAGLFSKTTGGLFISSSAKPESLVTTTAGMKTIEEIEAIASTFSQQYRAPAPPRPRYRPPADDDMDDPFADN